MIKQKILIKKEAMRKYELVPFIEERPVGDSRISPYVKKVKIRVNGKDIIGSYGKTEAKKIIRRMELLAASQELSRIC